MASYDTNGGSYASYGSGTSYSYGYGAAGVLNSPTNEGPVLRRRAVGGMSPTTAAPIPPAPKSSSIVKNLDFMFPKVDQEFRVQTEKGGLTTIIAVFVICLLSLAELASHISKNSSTIEHIAVNTELNKRMRINMNITFPALACEDLHVDAMDVAGDSQLDVEDTLVKKQLRLDGSMRSMDEIAVEMNGHRQEQEKKQRILKKALPEGYCGPCFGAQKTDDQCCQTCDELLAAYKEKRWKSDLLAYTAEQCIREGRDHKEPKKMRKGQGCNLSGYMTVNRVAGNFHIAMGEGVERDGRHIHTFLPEDSPNFNCSHIIHQMSFGPGEEDRSPLNGVVQIVGPEHGTTGLFQYFIKIVPTTYKGRSLMPKNFDANLPSIYDELEKNTDKQHVLETNRYFFTERFRPLMKEYIKDDSITETPGGEDKATVDAGHKGGHSNKDHHHVQNSVLPGIFFIYEISPFAVEISQNSVPLTHLLIRLIAIIGGVFTCASWLDAALCAGDSSKRKTGIRVYSE
ncbi:Endoplasmic Reticulum-Golgi Intermediate Compartment (ERGIC) [Fragilaria crotonensis]|nr:Endoplasmic Reticulum-Golgi Intermediate Compartment (ERGIC) [Fragilaria crotonensis]